MRGETVLLHQSRHGPPRFDSFIIIISGRRGGAGGGGGDMWPPVSGVGSG